MSIPGDTTSLPAAAKHEPGRTETALEAAAASRQHAASHIERSLQSINQEIEQQLGMRDQVIANISLLTDIALDLTRSLEATTDDRTGQSGALTSHRHLAKVKIELALQELELSKIDNVLDNLNLLRSRIKPREADGFKLAKIGARGISK